VASPPWPLTAATSSVTSLEFIDSVLPCEMICRMISRCKALMSFSWNDKITRRCRRGYHRIMCSRVISALEGHRDTLTQLYLRPCELSFDQHSTCHEIVVQGFQCLHQLESLQAPFTTMLGHPSGFRFLYPISLQCDWGQLRALFDLLPPKLRNLTLDLGGPFWPDKIDEYLISAMAAPLNLKTSLRSLAIRYHDMRWSESPPMN
jgi:hypothetical protein